MTYSLHSHSGQFCKHATGTLEEVVLEAIRQKFKVFGLTEHVPRYRLQDFYPEENNLTVEDLENTFKAYLVEAHRLKKAYASQIILLVGAETEYITEVDLSGLENLLKGNGNQIEYLIGSVHHVNSIPIDFDLPTFEKALEVCAALPVSPQASGDPSSSRAMTRFLNDYLDAQYTLMTRIKPEVIGHIDLCRLYSPKLDFRDYPEAWTRLERNIRYAVDYGALFEFNAAAFRKGWDTAYPGSDLVDLILNLGGRFTISDDSHGPHAVGLNYAKLAHYLHSIGIKEIWILSSSSVVNEAGRYLTPMCVAGYWWTDEFWEGLETNSMTALPKSDVI